MNYRYSLNLPYTEFSMKANLVCNEKLVLDYWNNINLYYLLANDKRKENFFINDGPPYANGDIHMGHAFNKILKDFINKFKFLEGFGTSFVPGWDCHGLPIEVNVEREIGSINSYLSKNIFRIKCRDYAQKYIDIQKNSFIKLGIMGDWSNYYKTMDYSFESSIIDTLSNIVGRGYVYNAEKPVYWCFDCKSALAEAEVDYFDKESPSLYISFNVFKNEMFFKKFKFLNHKDLNDLFIIIWTTTPWTLPFNEAVAVNPNATYVLLKNGLSGYIFDNTLLFDIINKLKIKNFDVLDVFFGIDLFNLKLFHPFYKKVVTVILSEHVKNDSGTGCVHIAPAYGLDDYNLGIEYNLLISNKIDCFGYFAADVLFFSGMHINDVNKKVLDYLKESNNLLFSSFIKHRHPCCWRHKIPLVFLSTKQWFIDIDDELIKFLKYGIENFIQWIPAWGKNRMMNMITSRPDWCISRQRLWGVPIVFLFDTDSNKFYDNMSYVMKYISERVKMYGTDIWNDLDIHKLFEIESRYLKVNDVLDVWYDSSNVFYFLLNKYKFYNIPFSLCLEGSDQYRGWFQVSLIMSSIICSDVQCASILTHGFVLDEFDKKMSKSLNNVISPNDILNKYGADILRLWVASSNYNVDVNISEKILLRICDSYRRIRNTMRFLLSNLYDFDSNFDLLDVKKFLSIDLWILYSLFNMQEVVLNFYKNYNFHFVCKNIHNFCVDELSSKYLDIIKDRLYTSKKNSASRRAAQTVIYYVVILISKLLSPILSFTSEEVWKMIFGNNSKTIFLPSIRFDIVSFDLNISFWNNIFFLREEVNKFFEKYRQNNIIKSTLDSNLLIYCSEEIYNFLLPVKNELHYFFITSSVELFVINQKFSFFENTAIDGFYLCIEKSFLKKCERCWHRSVENQMNLCNRCIDNLYYDGEKRYFV